MSKTLTIFHNTACGTSRRTLALIQEAGHEPDVIDYLKTGWTRAQLEGLLSAMGLNPRDILREKSPPAEALGLYEASATDDQILAAMVDHPVLVNRPIVISPKGTRLCRPAERVLELL